MEKNTVSGMMLTILLLSLLTFAFGIQPVNAIGTIYIRADGSVEPSTAPISSADNVTYFFTDNIYYQIRVERSNIIIDGKGFTVQGNGAALSNGIGVFSVNNVTIKEANIKGFYDGVRLDSSSGNSVSGNNITENSSYGIEVWISNNNNIYGNNIYTNYLAGGIRLNRDSNNNNISGNNITNNWYGVVLNNSPGSNRIFGNNITSNIKGITLVFSSSNRIYHNNLISNSLQVENQYYPYSTLVWDDGYPSGGNYWGDYAGVDVNGDGIGDSPYVIDAYNLDNYPLMQPWPQHDVAVFDMSLSKTVVRSGYSIQINVTCANQGCFPEDFTLTIYANGTAVNTTMVSSMPRSLTDTTFLWNTTGIVSGNYTISAYASAVLGETDIADNAHVDGTVLVVYPGDANLDGIVDLLDAALVSAHWYPGPPPGPLGYDPNCDLNSDGQINVVDLAIVSSYWTGPPKGPKVP